MSQNASGHVVSRHVTSCHITLEDTAPCCFHRISFAVLTHTVKAGDLIRFFFMFSLFSCLLSVCGSGHGMNHYDSMIGPNFFCYRTRTVVSRRSIFPYNPYDTPLPNSLPIPHRNKKEGAWLPSPLFLVTAKLLLINSVPAVRVQLYYYLLIAYLQYEYGHISNLPSGVVVVRCFSIELRGYLIAVWLRCRYFLAL